jgi:PIN domain nuclease of toxin-antitoxin system
MIAGVADTHTALWHLFDDKRLSAAAESFINEAATARRKIAISTRAWLRDQALIRAGSRPCRAHDSQAFS